MKNIQLIIPMSGMGNRFLKAGYSDPKPLIEVDGFPMIKHVVGLFPGVTDITFICNERHLSETNMRQILESIAPGCSIHEITCGNRGPVEAVMKISDFIKDDFETIVSYCDYGTKWDFNLFISSARDSSLDGSIACYRGFHPHMLGSDNYAFCREKDGLLQEIKEKEPFTDNRMEEYASNGTYYFRSGKYLKKYFQELIDLEISVNGEFYVSLVYNLLVRDGLKVGIFEIEKMLQWGTPYDLEIYKSWSRYFGTEMDDTEARNPFGTTLILPMAGRGSRFSQKGYELPKPMLEVDGEPMIVKAVQCLPKSDNNVFICLEEHLGRYSLEETLKDRFNGEIVSIEGTTEGQACTCEIGIIQANVNIESPIMISACDNGVSYDKSRYMDMVEDESIDIIVWSFRNNQTSKVNPNMYAWLEVDSEGYIKHVSCKKFIYDDPLNTHAIIGTMFFRKAKYFMDGLKKNFDESITTNGEYYVDDVINQNIKDGLKVKVFEANSYICWGTPDDYMTYNYWKEYFSL